MVEDHKIERFVGLGAVLLIAAGCFAVLKPFLSALLWGAIISYTTWPAFKLLRKEVGNRNTLAAALMTLLVTAVFLLPFILVAVALAENISRLAEMKHLVKNEIWPSVPVWLGKIPGAGQFPSDKWLAISKDTGLMLGYVRDFVVTNHSWFFRRIFDMGGAIFELSLSVFACFFFYRDGEFFFKIFDEAINRVAGTFKHHIVSTVGNTIKGVVYGIIVTALWQGVAAGFGFWLAGVPSAFLLGFLSFVLSPVPVGPPIIWIGSSIWLFKHGSTGWAIFMIIWGATAISSADNILKTYLISKSANVSFILILLGVLGGVLYFGFIGIFLGPVLLAIGYNILKEYCVKSHSPQQEENQNAPG